MKEESYSHPRMRQTLPQTNVKFMSLSTKSTFPFFLSKTWFLSLFTLSYFPSLLEHNKLTDSHSICTSAVLIFIFFLWGDKLARQRAVESLLRSKQDACLSGKIHCKELPPLSVLLPVSPLLSNSPSGQRSAPIASTWLEPSRNSYGAMSQSLTPSQILTV